MSDVEKAISQALYKEIINAEWKAYPDKYEICATEFVCSVCKESFVSSELTDEQFLE